MSKFHISKKGEPARCYAQEGACPLGEDTVHGDFPSADAARSWAEAYHAAQAGGSFGSSTLSKIKDEPRGISSDTFDVLKKNNPGLAHAIFEYLGVDTEGAIGGEEIDNRVYDKNRILESAGRVAALNIYNHLKNNQDKLSGYDVRDLVLSLSAAESKGLLNNDVRRDTAEIVQKFMKDGRIRPGFDDRSYFDQDPSTRVGRATPEQEARLRSALSDGAKAKKDALVEYMNNEFKDGKELENFRAMSSGARHSYASVLRETDNAMNIELRIGSYRSDSSDQRNQSAVFAAAQEEAAEALSKHLGKYVFFTVKVDEYDN